MMSSKLTRLGQTLILREGLKLLILLKKQRKYISRDSNKKTRIFRLHSGISMML